MNNSPNKKIDKEKEELKEKISNIIKNGFKEYEKGKKEVFKNTSSDFEEKLDELLKETEEEHKQLSDRQFKLRITLITFGGVLVALMVGSLDKINYSIYGFVSLICFVLFSLLDFLVYHLKNEYHFIDGKYFMGKIKKVFSFCKKTNYRKDVLEDTKSFIRSATLDLDSRIKEDYGNIPELLKDFDKKNSIIKKFGAKLLWELIVMGLFILGILFMAKDILIYVLSNKI